MVLASFDVVVLLPLDADGVGIDFDGLVFVVLLGEELVLRLLKINTWLFLLRYLGQFHLLMLRLLLFTMSLLPLLVPTLTVLAATLVVVVVVAFGHSHGHVDLFLDHEGLPRVLRWIYVHLDMLAAFDLLLVDLVELGGARPININIGLLAFPVAFVSEFVRSLYLVDWLLVFCVEFNFAVILILHLIVIHLLIDILFLLSLYTLVYLVNIYWLIVIYLLHLHLFNGLFPFI